jgi:hypothetical protein
VQVHAHIGKVPHLGIDGVIADKDFSPGDSIITIPYNLTVQLSPAVLASPVNPLHVLSIL